MKTLKVVEKSKIWFGIAILLVVVSLGSLLIRGLDFGIDFKGGTIITIDLHTQFNTEDVRKITDEFDNSAEITYSGDTQEQVVISTKENMDAEKRTELFEKFKDQYKLEDTDLISADSVTATVGSETARNAIIAAAVAVLLMLIYITFRFEFFFGLSAVITLIFDITIVIGVYALLQIQVNAPFIAAILTILGYSINDTIVVFDRIRENENILGVKEIESLVDTSITQTLRRSLYTVATTLLAILSLYILGVEAIRDFALPLVVGIATGCYGSIFVASPLWVFFQKKFPISKRNKKMNKGNRRKRQAKIEV
ncbi:MAG: protein translocase subunit SecF [Eubacterium sp.]|nr:protein translocase subunit SecF [Eubacterium sp.]